MGSEDGNGRTRPEAERAGDRPATQEITSERPDPGAADAGATPARPSPALAPQDISRAVTELVAPAPVAQKAPAHLGPGTELFGAYEIIDMLGAGGMGEVYRARHLSLGGLRAIKVMHPELAHRADALARFHAEARALLDVHHPAVVGCHDLLRDDAGRVYLVMEMVEGQSLLERIQDKPLSEAETIKLGIRLAEGLDAAHACGVIHRDLSPDNILLPHGQVEHAKIIDFGIAKALASGEETISEGFKGKLAYASPEQLGFFDGRIDARSDLYSLGLVLCAAANGTPLAMGTNLKEAVDARQDFRVARQKIPPGLRKEIAPLLALDPADRPASAGQTFATWRGGAEVLPPQRSRSMLVLGLAALALSIAAGFWLSGPSRDTIETPERRPPTAERPAAQPIPTPPVEVEPSLPEAPPGTELARANFASTRSWLLGTGGSDRSLDARIVIDPNPVRDGSSYRVTLSANCRCYLLLFSVAGDGTEVTLLYPNPYDVLARSQPGVPLTLPASTGYEFEAIAEAGKDVLRLVAVGEWPDFPPTGSGFWSANWLQPEGTDQLEALRARLEGTRWMAVGTTLEISR